MPWDVLFIQWSHRQLSTETTSKTDRTYNTRNRIQTSCDQRWPGGLHNMLRWSLNCEWYSSEYFSLKTGSHPWQNCRQKPPKLWTERFWNHTLLWMQTLHQVSHPQFCRCMLFLLWYLTLTLLVSWIKKHFTVEQILSSLIMTILSTEGV